MKYLMNIICRELGEKMKNKMYTFLFKKNIFFTLMYAISIILILLAYMLLFPSVSQGSAYGDLLKAMPQDMLEAIGMVGDITNLNDYLNMNFYNSIYIYILAAFVIVLSSKLVSKPLDDTSLVYYINSPVSRVKYMLTNIGIIMTLMVLIFLSSILGVAIGKIFLDSSTTVDWNYLFATNLVLTVIFIFFSSVSLLICALVNTNSEALVYATTFILGEYVIDMLCKVSEKVEKMKYLTVFTIYDVEGIELGEEWIIVSTLVLLAISALIFVLATVIFKKRDLHI